MTTAFTASNYVRRWCERFSGAFSLAQALQVTWGFTGNKKTESDYMRCASSRWRSRIVITQHIAPIITECQLYVGV